MPAASVGCPVKGQNVGRRICLYAVRPVGDEMYSPKILKVY
jgi:hypothetical protein